MADPEAKSPVDPKPDVTPAKPDDNWFNRNVTGAFKGLTHDAGEWVEKISNERVPAKTVRSWLPVIGATAAGVTGLLLIEPLGWIGRGIGSVAKSVLTGFGYFEKIPLLGGAFTFLGKGVDIIGEVMAYGLTALASFVTYKGLQEPPPEPAKPNLTPHVGEASKNPPTVIPVGVPDLAIPRGSKLADDVAKKLESAKEWLKRLVDDPNEKEIDGKAKTRLEEKIGRGEVENVENHLADSGRKLTKEGAKRLEAYKDADVAKKSYEAQDSLVSRIARGTLEKIWIVKWFVPKGKTRINAKAEGQSASDRADPIGKLLAEVKAGMKAGAEKPGNPDPVKADPAKTDDGKNDVKADDAGKQPATDKATGPKDAPSTDARQPLEYTDAKSGKMTLEPVAGARDVYADNVSGRRFRIEVGTTNKPVEVKLSDKGEWVDIEAPPAAAAPPPTVTPPPAAKPADAPAKAGADAAGEPGSLVHATSNGVTESFIVTKGTKGEVSLQVREAGDGKGIYETVGDGPKRYFLMKAETIKSDGNAKDSVTEVKGRVVEGKMEGGKFEPIAAAPTSQAAKPAGDGAKPAENRVDNKAPAEPAKPDLAGKSAKPNNISDDAIGDSVSVAGAGGKITLNGAAARLFGGMAAYNDGKKFEQAFFERDGTKTYSKGDVLQHCLGPSRENCILVCSKDKKVDNTWNMNDPLKSLGSNALNVELQLADKNWNPIQAKRVVDKDGKTKIILVSIDKNTGAELSGTPKDYWDKEYSVRDDGTLMSSAGPIKDAATPPADVKIVFPENSGNGPMPLVIATKQWTVMSDKASAAVSAPEGAAGLMMLAGGEGKWGKTGGGVMLIAYFGKEFIESSVMATNGDVTRAGTHMGGASTNIGCWFIPGVGWVVGTAPGTLVERMMNGEEMTGKEFVLETAPGMIIAPFVDVADIDASVWKDFDRTIGPSPIIQDKSGKLYKRNGSDKDGKPQFEEVKITADNMYLLYPALNQAAGQLADSSGYEKDKITKDNFSSEEKNIVVGMRKMGNKPGDVAFDNLTDGEKSVIAHLRYEAITKANFNADEIALVAKGRQEERLAWANAVPAKANLTEADRTYLADKKGRKKEDIAFELLTQEEIGDLSAWRKAQKPPEVTFDNLTPKEKDGLAQVRFDAKHKKVFDEVRDDPLQVWIKLWNANHAKKEDQFDLGNPATAASQRQKALDKLRECAKKVGTNEGQSSVVSQMYGGMAEAYRSNPKFDSWDSVQNTILPKIVLPVMNPIAAIKESISPTAGADFTDDATEFMMEHVAADLQHYVDARLTSGRVPQQPFPIMIDGFTTPDGIHVAPDGSKMAVLPGKPLEPDANVGTNLLTLYQQRDKLKEKMDLGSTEAKNIINQTGLVEQGSENRKYFIDAVDAALHPKDVAIGKNMMVTTLVLSGLMGKSERSLAYAKSIVPDSIALSSTVFPGAKPGQKGFDVQPPVDLFCQEMEKFYGTGKFMAGKDGKEFDTTTHFKDMSATQKLAFFENALKYYNEQMDFYEKDRCQASNSGGVCYALSYDYTKEGKGNQNWSWYNLNWTNGDFINPYSGAIASSKFEHGTVEIPGGKTIDWMKEHEFLQKTLPLQLIPVCQKTENSKPGDHHFSQFDDPMDAYKSPIYDADSLISGWSTEPMNGAFSAFNTDVMNLAGAKPEEFARTKLRDHMQKHVDLLRNWISAQTETLKTSPLIPEYERHVKLMKASFTLANTGVMLVASSHTNLMNPNDANSGIDPLTGKTRTGDWILVEDVRTGASYYLEGEWGYKKSKLAGNVGPQDPDKPGEKEFFQVTKITDEKGNDKGAVKDVVIDLDNASSVTPFYNAKGDKLTPDQGALAKALSAIPDNNLKLISPGIELVESSETNNNIERATGRKRDGDWMLIRDLRTGKMYRMEGEFGTQANGSDRPEGFFRANYVVDLDRGDKVSVRENASVSKDRPIVINLADASKATDVKITDKETVKADPAALPAALDEMSRRTTGTVYKDNALPSMTNLFPSPAKAGHSLKTTLAGYDDIKGDKTLTLGKKASILVTVSESTAMNAPRTDGSQTDSDSTSGKGYSFTVNGIFDSTSPGQLILLPDTARPDSIVIHNMISGPKDLAIHVTPEELAAAQEGKMSEALSNRIYKAWNAPATLLRDMKANGIKDARFGHDADGDYVEMTDDRLYDTECPGRDYIPGKRQYRAYGTWGADDGSFEVNKVLYLDKDDKWQATLNGSKNDERYDWTYSNIAVPGGHPLSSAVKRYIFKDCELRSEALGEVSTRQRMDARGYKGFAFERLKSSDESRCEYKEDGNLVLRAQVSVGSGMEGSASEKIAYLAFEKDVSKQDLDDLKNRKGKLARYQGDLQAYVNSLPVSRVVAMKDGVAVKTIDLTGENSIENLKAEIGKNSKKLAIDIKNETDPEKIKQAAKGEGAGQSYTPMSKEDLDSLGKIDFDVEAVTAGGGFKAAYNVGVKTGSLAAMKQAENLLGALRNVGRVKGDTIDLFDNATPVLAASTATNSNLASNIGEGAKKTPGDTPNPDGKPDPNAAQNPSGTANANAMPGANGTLNPVVPGAMPAPADGVPAPGSQPPVPPGQPTAPAMPGQPPVPGDMHANIIMPPMPAGDPTGSLRTDINISSATGNMQLRLIGKYENGKFKVEQVQPLVGGVPAGPPIAVSQKIEIDTNPGSNPDNNLPQLIKLQDIINKGMDEPKPDTTPQASVPAKPAAVAAALAPSPAPSLLQSVSINSLGGFTPNAPLPAASGIAAPTKTTSA